MSIRQPAVAGRFYSDVEKRCRADLRACLPERPDAALDGLRCVGGLMPHAGWMCSGAVAGRIAAGLCAGWKSTPPSAATVVIFGAVHFWPGSRAAVFADGQWITPLGSINIDAALAQRVLAAGGDLFEANGRAHDGEHSIEVEVPFFQQLVPAARLLPIMVPPNTESAAVGRAVARGCRDADVCFVASSDLTHYGPSYGFTPQGAGEAGLAWAKNVNDRRIIELMLSMRSDEIVAEAHAHQNACGAGAIAAAIAACGESGATRGVLLQHTNSYEVLRERFHEPPTDAVGYAGIAFVAGA